MHTRRLLLPLVVLLPCTSPCPAMTGPIREARTAEEIVDSFDSDPVRHHHRTRGQVQPQLTRRTGYAKHGTRSLLIEIPPTGESGRNSLLLSWSFQEPVDWTAWDGMSLWYQAQDEASPGFTASVSEGSGAQYWRKVKPLPRKAGEWQLVELPFRGFSWSWEAREDGNKRFDREAVRMLVLEIRGSESRPVVFALDGLGLYRAEPPYTGPTISITPDAGGWRRKPGEPYALRLAVKGLPAGHAAEAEVLGVDYRGVEHLRRRFTFTGPADGGQPAAATFQLVSDRANYVDITARLSVDGVAVYRAERAAAWIRPLDPLDAVPNPNSIFGIWVGGGQWTLGAKWSRTYLRGSDVDLVDGQYVVRNGAPGVYAPKLSDQLSYTFYFSKMPKWLTSRPERADWYKWSPTSWEEYGKFVEFAVRGAYNAGVRHFEVWNEPVPYAYWMGPIESVVKLHEVTYKAAKRVAADTIVLGPCPYSFVWDFMRKFFDLGGGKWIDEVVIHAYGKDPDLEFAQNLRKLRELLGKYGLGGRDVYITEKGFSTPQFSEKQQARNLVKSYVYALSEGIRLLTWHMLWDYTPEGDPGSAILRHDHTPRPAYCAYTTLTSVLERADYTGLLPELAATQRGFAFAKRDTVIRVLWDTVAGPSRAVIKSPASSATRLDLVGGETVVVPKAPGEYELQLTRDPVYFITQE